MSDGPSKAYPDARRQEQAEPLDDIILTEDDNTVAEPPPVVAPKASSPPRAPSQRPPPAPSSGPPPASVTAAAIADGASGRPSSGPLKAAKRAKMTLRIPDDEIARPAPQTPAGGFGAAPAYTPDDTIELPAGQISAQVAAIAAEPRIGKAPGSVPPATGVDATHEPGWTPYQVQVAADDVDDNATTGHHPAIAPAPRMDGRLVPATPENHHADAGNPVGPISEEIPVEMDLEGVPTTTSDEIETSPRLPSASDSEEIRIDDGSERISIPMGETGEVEIAAEDLLSSESLPSPPLKTAGKYPAFRGEEPPAGTASALMAGVPGIAQPQVILPTVTPVMGVPAVSTQTGFAARRAPTVQAVGGLAPPPMTDNAAARKKTRPWWEELFNDDFIRTMAKVTDAQIGSEVTFIEESLGCEAGAMILDLACGTGRHAVELAARGYQVVGFDLSLAMLARASDEAQDRKQKINFVQGDMREMTFEDTFDGVFSWNTSFGYFDEEKNAAVIAKVHKSLKKGGQFLLDVVNRDYIVRQAPSLAWFEGDGCICMDEMTIDFITSRMKVKRTLMMDDGRTKEIEYSVRVYALHELGKMLHDNGFRVAEVSGRTSTPGVFFGCEAPRTLILAEKR